MARARFTSPLLIGVLIGASIPALYLLDLLVHIDTSQEEWLSGQLDVHLDGQEPGRFAVELHPEGDWFVGAADLHQAEFPWDPTDRHAQLRLRLTPGVLEAAAPGEYPTGWAASYAERLQTSELWTPPLPCAGVIVVRTIAVEGAQGEPSQITRLEMALDLRCTSAGPDLAWGTEDDRTWTIEGPMELRTGRR